MKKTAQWVLLGAIVVVAVIFAFHFIPAGNHESVEERVEEAVKDEISEVRQEEQDPVTKLMENMSIEEKIGQLFLIRTPQENVDSVIEKEMPGGLVLFGVDFENETADSFREKIQNWQSVSKIPLLIASDEEGGDVTRISYNQNLVSEFYQSPQELYNQGGIDAVREDAQKKSKELLSYGINFNLAPVADVSTDPNSFIYSRTIGQDAQTTADVIGAIVDEMKKAGIGSSLKHFPGYGNNLDSHGEIVHDTKDLETFETVDFLPFKAGIENGANSVMVTHNIIEAVDPDHPGSLSPAVYGLLRNNLGFNGVAITDDFDMAGLSDYTDQDTAALMALQAGADMIISSSYEQQIPAVLEAVNNGTLSQDRVNEAVERVLRMKQSLGLITQ